MKKRIFFILTAAVLAFALAACGDQKKPDAAEPGTETVTEKVTEKQTNPLVTEKQTETAAPETHETADYPASEGWYVDSGLAIQMRSFYFSTERPELMIDGMMEIAGDKEVVPGDTVTFTVLQDGKELKYISGADMAMPVTADVYMPLSEIYATAGDSYDVKVRADFADGHTHTWTFDTETMMFK